MGVAQGSSGTGTGRAGMLRLPCTAQASPLLKTQALPGPLSPVPARGVNPWPLPRSLFDHPPRVQKPWKGSGSL